MLSPGGSCIHDQIAMKMKAIMSAKPRAWSAIDCANLASNHPAIHVTAKISRLVRRLTRRLYQDVGASATTTIIGDHRSRRDSPNRDTAGTCPVVDIGLLEQAEAGFPRKHGPYKKRTAA